MKCKDFNEDDDFQEENQQFNQIVRDAFVEFFRCDGAKNPMERLLNAYNEVKTKVSLELGNRPFNEEAFNDQFQYFVQDIFPNILKEILPVNKV